MMTKQNKKKWVKIFWIVNAILLILTAVCAGIMIWISGRLTSVQAADRWRGKNEMRFTQIACFLPITESRTEEEILQFRRELDQKLIESAVIPSGEGKLFQDAWSSPGSVSVSTDHGSAQVHAIGVGGNFFLFHPYQLRSGSYLQEDDLMKDRVILDEELAWILFGSPDVAGLEVHINGKSFYVAGVIHRDQDFASRRAYREGPSLYLSYNALNEISDLGISCYEIVLPDLIHGFGAHLMQENFPIGSGTMVENTNRFSIGKLLNVAKDYGYRSMGMNGVVCPYWENAVRMTEDYLAAMLVLTILLSFLPAVSGLLLLAAGAHWLWKKGKQKVPAFADRLVQRRREEQYENRNSDQHSGVH